MAEHKFSYTWGNVKKKEFPIIEGEATPERENVRERKKEADQGFCQSLWATGKEVP